jgi:hypothetical protein
MPYPMVRRPPVNSLAVAALICSPLPGFPAAVGVITALVARRQIRQTGERGEGIATAAFFIGMFTLVGFVLYMIGLAGFGY